MQVSCAHLEGCRVPEDEDGHLQSYELVDHNQGTPAPTTMNRATVHLQQFRQSYWHLQDDAVVVSPRIDSLDCNDLGPYLPHGLGSVNTMMLGASVCSLYILSSATHVELYRGPSAALCCSDTH